MLGFNELFKKKVKKEKPVHKIDFVITDLEVKLESDHSPFGCFANFTFIDEKPNFPRVRHTLCELEKHQDAYVLNHNYTFREITLKTDLTGLNIIRH